MSRRSRSTLFLIEQLIVVAIFAICAAACVRIMSHSYFMARDSRNLSIAILIAESCAESYKAASGDLRIVAELLGGAIIAIDSRDVLTLFYDSGWLLCSEEDAFFQLRLIDESVADSSSRIVEGRLFVEKLTGEEIMTFEVVAGRGAA